MTGHENFSALGLDELGASPLQPGDPSQMGPFRIVARLAAGGMGRVYLARDPATPGLAALKVLRSEYAEDADFRIRFEREVATIGLAQGPHTATLLGSAFDDDLLWIATGYLPGINLSEAVARFGLLDPPSAWRLTGDLAAAVGTVADAGVVHRDVKPSNVVLTGGGAYLIDFGISQAADMTAITKTGVAVGTPAFMSPEQVSGKGTGTPSDVFSLASVVAYAVTRHAPFGDGATVDVLHRIAYEPPKDEVLEQIADQDPDLADLITRCLGKDEAARPSPSELAEAVAAHGPPAEWPEPIRELIQVRENRCAAVSAADGPEAAQDPTPDSTPTTVVTVAAPDGPAAAQDPAPDSTPTMAVRPSQAPAPDSTPTTVVRTALTRPDIPDTPGGPTREAAATGQQSTRNRKRAAAVGAFFAAALAAVTAVAVVAHGAGGGRPAVKPSTQTTDQVVSVDTSMPTSAGTTTEDATSSSYSPLPTKHTSASTGTPSASASPLPTPSSPPDTPSATNASPTPSGSPTSPDTPTVPATPTSPTIPGTPTDSATPTSPDTSTSTGSSPGSSPSPHITSGG